MNFNEERDTLKKYIDEDVRSLYTEERVVNKYQIEEKLIYITNELSQSFQTFIEPIRKRIQGIESDIAISKYDWQEALKKHCSSKKELKRVDRELEVVEESLDTHYQVMRDIEDECNSSDTKGDLKRFPMWVFVLLMSIAGLAEIAVYYNVFLSQEIGLAIDQNTWLDTLLYKGMALFMATGFTVMLIWLSHKLGMLLRQVGSVHRDELKSYWIKFGVILLIVVSAIVATVQIRSSMHEVMYLEHQIDVIADSDSDSSDMFDMEDDEDSIGGMESMENDLTETVSKEEKLRTTINQMKGDAAYLFIVINFFIVISGVFLSYEVHTSNITYEALEGIIGRLKKQRNNLIKTQNRLRKKLQKEQNSNLMSQLKLYVNSVNTFDENSQTIKSYTIAIENVYLELVMYLLGALEEHKLLIEVESDVLDTLVVEKFRKRFEEEWKLEKIDVEAAEVMHIGNIDEFLETFECRQTKDRK